jgi:hypothetical protein
VSTPVGDNPRLCRRDFVAQWVESEWMRVLFGLVFKGRLKSCVAVFAVPEHAAFVATSDAAIVAA